MTCAAARHSGTAYSSGSCRCPTGREAYRLYRKRLREGRQPPALIPAVGTTRRLQALVAIGYCWTHLANRLGVSTKCVRIWGLHPEARVTRGTHHRVRALFTALSDSPGPSRYARTVAARYGFAVPAAWDDGAIDDPNWTPAPLDSPDTIVDEVAIDRALSGERIRLNRLEQHHAVHVGLARGLTRQAVADALHMAFDTANRLAGKPLPGNYELAA